MRLYHLLRMFREFSEVHLLTLESWTPEPEVSRAHLRDLLGGAEFISHGRDERVAKARSLLGTHSLDFVNYQSHAFQDALDATLTAHDFDVVVTEMTPMAGYRLEGFTGLKILDLQNIEHELVRRRAANAGRGPRRWALELDWRKTRREELGACSRFDLVFAPSERECELLRTMVPGQEFVTVANTIDPDRIPFDGERRGGSELLFIGATHVDANRDGLIWFVGSVLPLIEQRVPDVRLTVVGGNPPAEVRDLGRRPNVEIAGFVEDIEPCFRRAAAQIIPLRSGGGTRLKLLDGLSAGLPTISTTVGAEGIDVVDREHVLIADEPVDLADRAVELLADRELQRRLARAGRSLVESRYAWQGLCDDVETVVRSALDASRA